MVAQRKNSGKRGQGISSGRFVRHEKDLGLILNTRGSHRRARSKSAGCSDVLIRPPRQQRENGLQGGQEREKGDWEGRPAGVKVEEHRWVPGGSAELADGLGVRDENKRGVGISS